MDKQLIIQFIKQFSEHHRIDSDRLIAHKDCSLVLNDYSKWTTVVDLWADTKFVSDLIKQEKKDDRYVWKRLYERGEVVYIQIAENVRIWPSRIGYGDTSTLKSRWPFLLRQDEVTFFSIRQTLIQSLQNTELMIDEKNDQTVLMKNLLQYSSVHKKGEVYV